MKHRPSILCIAFVLLLSCCNRQVPASADIENQKVLEKILEQAIHMSHLQSRGEKGQELKYLPNNSFGYTGWAYEHCYFNGSPIDQLGEVTYFLNGKPKNSIHWESNGQKVHELKTNKQGLETIRSWYSNGLIRLEITTNYELLETAVSYKPCGLQCEQTNIFDGTGKLVYYDEKGKKIRTEHYEHGKIRSYGFPVQN